ncbi:nuclear transport factor 2 family protein [Frigoribacterium sp. R86507]|uniref:nuclear transport factor 2 family protein n=1 Tax=Frigoribacterium sp. R86507 TaxID=3093850 RepID=UPI0037CAD81A
MSTHATVSELTIEDVTSWVEKYLLAWRTNATADIEALFTQQAEYHERPYTTDLVGRDDIVAGWQSRWNWQQGGWTFTWTAHPTSGRTVVIDGVGRYQDLGDFDNVWTVTIDEDGRCSRFEMLNTEQD